MLSSAFKAGNMAFSRSARLSTGMPCADAFRMPAKQITAKKAENINETRCCDSLEERICIDAKIPTRIREVEERTTRAFVRRFVFCRQEAPGRCSSNQLR